MKKTLFLMFLLFCFTTNVLANGQTTLLSRSVQEATFTGTIPEVDGITDDNLRKSINAVLKTRVQELSKALPGGCTITYYPLLNKTSIFSVMLTATGEGKTLYQGVNIDITTGKECLSGDFFRDKEGLSAALGNYEDFVFADAGVYTRTDKYASYDAFVPYASLLQYVDIGEAGRFLSVYRLTNAAAECVLRVKAGDLIALKLDSNRSTGYVWELAQTSKNTGLLEVGTSYVMPVNAEKNALGASGMDIIVLGGVKPGKYPIKFEYKRQWEKYAVSSLEFELVVE